MKRMIRVVLLVLMLALTACGDDWYDDYYYPYPYPYPYPRPPTSSEILSNSTLDGYISRDPVTGAFTVRQGMSSTVQSVLAGTNPATGDENRGFLYFTGGVKANTHINTAILEIFINTIQTQNGTIPVRIDLVSVPQQLSGADFDSTFLATVSRTFFQSDLGQYVDIDVMPLMAQAQTLGLADFQIRIIVGTSPGFIEINDTTGANRVQLAPLLIVTY